MGKSEPSCAAGGNANGAAAWLPQKVTRSAAPRYVLTGSGNTRPAKGRARTCAVFVGAEGKKAAQMCISIRVDQRSAVHPQRGMLFDYKRNEALTQATR